MRRGKFLACAMGCGLLVCTLFAQNPFRQFPAWEYYNFPLPPDYTVPGEWTFARLMYPTTHLRFDWQSEYRRGFDWREGNTNWTMDYPRSDRHFAQAVRRLTRVHARIGGAARQSGRRRRCVQLALALRRGSRPLGSDRRAGGEAPRVPAARRLLHVRRFPRHATNGRSSWTACARSFPDRPIVEIWTTRTPIFHTIFDLDDRYQVPGAQFLSTSVCEKYELRRHDPALARHLRRQRPADGGHLPQHGPRRFLGARGRSAVSGEVFGAGNPHRRQLCRLRDDALGSTRSIDQTDRGVHVLQP